MDPIAEAAALLLASRPAAVLTGAGVSAESGVPDFRSPGGIWRRFDPELYATAEALQTDPDRTWRFFAELILLLRGALPNPAHHALAELSTLGIVGTVVTQNLDGLHQRAGSKDVVEFHGGSFHRCQDCGARVVISEEQLSQALAGRAPRHGCGGVIRPDVVLFGEDIPAAAAAAAARAIGTAGSLLVVGTSAQVYPAASIPGEMARHGKPVIEVNLEETPVTALARISLRGHAAQVMPRLAAAVRRLLPR